MNVRWEIGPRNPVGTEGKRGFEPRLGKNQGPVIQQTVVKVYYDTSTAS